MKKQIIIYFACLFVVFSACKKDFLDENAFSAYSPESLKDSLGFDASLIGLYNHFSTFYTRSDRQGWVSVWNAGTDIAYAASPEGVETPYYKYELLNSQDHAASWCWTWAYRMINNANIIITAINDPTLQLTQATKNSISGEARFFRGYAYNFLATLYGRVPVITEPLSAPKTDFTRNALNDVNKVVEDDLTFAAANLTEPGNVNSSTNANGRPAGRVNRYIAMQVLAEAYLRMGKNDLAEQRAQAIINSGKYGLNTTRFGTKASGPGDVFSDLFIKGNIRRSQGNKESIWVLEIEDRRIVPGGYTGDPQQRRNWGTGYHNITGMKITDSLGGRGIGRMRLSNWVVYGLYDANDIRNSQYNIRRRFYYNDPASPKLGQQVPYVGSDTNTNIAPHTTKWYQFDPTDEFGYAMLKDLMLMRLGETYLLLAEAQFKQNKPGDAATTLTTLRARSNAGPVAAGSVTLNFILDERARELLAEENRRMTLMRTGTLVARVTALNMNSALNPVSGLANKHMLLPIPLSEINLNKDAILEQNPDY